VLADGARVLGDHDHPAVDGVLHLARGEVVDLGVGGHAEPGVVEHVALDLVAHLVVAGGVVILTGVQVVRALGQVRRELVEVLGPRLAAGLVTQVLVREQLVLGAAGGGVGEALGAERERVRGVGRGGLALGAGAVLLLRLGLGLLLRLASGGGLALGLGLLLLLGGGGGDILAACADVVLVDLMRRREGVGASRSRLLLVLRLLVVLLLLLRVLPLRLGLLVYIGVLAEVGHVPVGGRAAGVVLARGRRRGGGVVRHGRCVGDGGLGERGRGGGGCAVVDVGVLCTVVLSHVEHARVDFGETLLPVAVDGAALWVRLHVGVLHQRGVVRLAEVRCERGLRARVDATDVRRGQGAARGGGGGGGGAGGAGVGLGLGEVLSTLWTWAARGAGLSSGGGRCNGGATLLLLVHAGLAAAGLGAGHLSGGLHRLRYGARVRVGGHGAAGEAVLDVNVGARHTRGGGAVVALLGRMGTRGARRGGDTGASVGVGVGVGVEAGSAVVWVSVGRHADLGVGVGGREEVVDGLAALCPGHAGVVLRAVHAGGGGGVAAMLGAVLASASAGRALGLALDRIPRERGGALVADCVAAHAGGTAAVRHATALLLGAVELGGAVGVEERLRLEREMGSGLDGGVGVGLGCGGGGGSGVDVGVGTAVAAGGMVAISVARPGPHARVRAAAVIVRARGAPLILHRLRLEVVAREPPRGLILHAHLVVAEGVGAVGVRCLVGAGGGGEGGTATGRGHPGDGLDVL
jgi:hypothetical protein